MSELIVFRCQPSELRLLKTLRNHWKCNISDALRRCIRIYYDMEARKA